MDGENEVKKTNLIEKNYEKMDISDKKNCKNNRKNNKK